MKMKFAVSILTMAVSTFAFAQGEPVPALQNPIGSTVENRAPAPSPAPTPNLPPQEMSNVPGAANDSQSKAPAQPRDRTISVTKVVGEVGERVITSREVKINSAIEQAFREVPMSPDIKGNEGYRIPDLADRSFIGEVSKVLDEWAVYFEAKSLSSSSAPKAEVTRVIGLVKERWAGRKDWQELEVGNEELSTVIERKLVADDFQKLKSDPALSPVSDDEALAYYKKNRLRFGSLPFSSFKDNIKSYLVKSSVERRLSEWHEVLRRKYKTRNFISG